MFHGSIPAPLRSIIYEHAGTWPDQDIYVGCSGNFTIERVLHARFGASRAVHGNDVQAYSCALGWWLAGQPLPFTLREDYEDDLGWLKPYLEDPTDLLATLMLGTRFLQWVGKTGAYYRRMIAATQDQWPRMHDKTATKLRNLTVRLGSYYAGDVLDYLTDVVPADAPVVMFPPFYGGDYESQFAPIDAAFDWPVPNFNELTEDGKEQIIAQVRDRPHWMLGLHIERPELRDQLAGVVQTANRGLPIYVYAASGPRRIVRPRQQVAPIPMPKIGPDDELGDRMTLHMLTGGQFAAIRSQFMSKSIKPGSPLLACGVAVDGKLIGAFAYLPPKYEPSCAYLMSDFPVSWTRYRRLAKLIVMAASTQEAQLLLQRSLSRRITAWSTTAFTDNPNSAKYGRGIPGVVLQKRSEPAGDGVHRYQLQYGGPVGNHTLAQALDLWKRKHGKDQR
ncbi:putative antirestriction adenine methyltransferase [Microtetraspora malaysiensis]|uniref:N-acetyltransferase domain-containing protein n=1 Tax=Microtetraspora malaysiensis TaxID=161358 RepID=A0ABW6SKF1_9ACTN